MPTYRYRCERCGEDFEVWQSITDDSFTTHEGECGGHLVKVLSPAGIVLKGSGFYKNDSRSGNGKRSGGSREKTDSGKSDSGSSSGSDGGGSSDSGSSDSGSKSGSDSEVRIGRRRLGLEVRFGRRELRFQLQVWIRPRVEGLRIVGLGVQEHEVGLLELSSLSR